MAHPTADNVNKPNVPLRIARFGILGAFLGVGVLEAISFLFFACPCMQPYVMPENVNQVQPVETNPTPPKLGGPVPR